MAYVMVIDDSEDMCRLMRSLLGFLDHSSVIFSAGTDALEHLEQPGNVLPDLIWNACAVCGPACAVVTSPWLYLLPTTMPACGSAPDSPALMRFG
jgi:CheY-like chemotaxis protein